MATKSWNYRPAAADHVPEGLPASWRWYGAPLQVAALTWPRTPVAHDGRALLLDRDGTVIVDTGYLRDPSQVRLVPEAVVAMQQARDRGWRLGLVTNQGGIGLGLSGWAELAAVHGAVEAALERLGLRLDVVLACPYHPRGEHPQFGRSAPLPLGRKPGPGMVRLAAEMLGLGQRAQVLVVGDKESDVAAAIAAGREGLRVAACRTADWRTADGSDRDASWGAVRRRLDRGWDPR